MNNPYDKVLYTGMQTGMGNAMKRKREKDMLDEQLRQFDITRSDNLNANSWDEKTDPDWLQALLGGLETAGGIASTFTPAGAIVGAPLVSAGLGSASKGLGRRRAVNRRTGEEKYI